jgi:hypothetical protein
MTFTIDIARDGCSGTQYTEDGPIETWLEYFFIVAASERGDRYALVEAGEGAGIVASHNEATAREALALVDHTPDTRPDLWTRCDPVYGSEAWTDEDEHALACFEADAYDEPRPQWF